MGSRTTFTTGLNYPTGLAFDSAGTLFNTDEWSGRIDETTPAGVTTNCATGLDHLPRF